MEFIQKYWWAILLGLVVIFFFMSRSKAQTGVGVPLIGPSTTVQDTGQGTAPAVNPTVVGYGTTGGYIPFNPTTHGTPDMPGVLLTGSQCRQSCRGKCGSRCILNIGRKCKSKKLCWNNCKATVCGHLNKDELKAFYA